MEKKYIAEKNFNTKDKYVKVKEELLEKPKSNEVRVSKEGKPSKFLYWGIHLMNKYPDKIIVKAIGNAIHKAFIVAELLKRRIRGLHQ